ncbi:hypothetical protein [Planococcus sp. SSTMD024]|uniref:hypothetical protein n=1 Tax=Planococcus sp. SSTMD024 TaxID=3242163 RepID=UPI00351EFABC
MNKFLRRNIPNIFLLIAYGIFIYFILVNDYLAYEEVLRSHHVEILTINTIFIGFLYTTLGVMVGFLGNNKVSNMDRAGYMDEYYYTIYVGLLFFIGSATFGIIAVFFKDFTTNIYIYLFEQIFLFGGLIFFIKALYNLIYVIKKVRNNL